jgi:raffinose/stachyose/melibiose transport system permease protein
MPLSVYGFFGRYSSSWNLVFADLALTALPVVILYLAAQKYVVSGLLVGAVKQ